VTESAEGLNLGAQQSLNMHDATIWKELQSGGEQNLGDGGFWGRVKSGAG